MASRFGGDPAGRETAVTLSMALRGASLDFGARFEGVWRSVATIWPLRWCTTSSSPGSSSGPDAAPRTPGAGPAGGCTARPAPCAPAARARPARRPARWRPPPRGRPSPPGSSAMSAYGATVVQHRRLLLETTRSTPYAPRSGTSCVRLELTGLHERRSRSSPRQDLRERAWAGARRAAGWSASEPDELVEDVPVALAGQPFARLLEAATRAGRSPRWAGRGRCRRRRSPGRPVVHALGAHGAVADEVLPVGQGRAEPDVEAGLLGDLADRAVDACSPGSSLPFGNDQSSYFGRCTSSTSALAPPRSLAADHGAGRDDLRAVHPASLTSQRPIWRNEGWTLDEQASVVLVAGRVLLLVAGRRWSRGGCWTGRATRARGRLPPVPTLRVT